jgi:hypothetical protein
VTLKLVEEYGDEAFAWVGRLRGVELRAAFDDQFARCQREAADTARREVATYLRERAARHEHGVSGSVIADVLRECALAVEVTP